MPKYPGPFDEPKDLATPRIIGVLLPVAGGEENLLPKDAWLRPLRVEFERWSESAPNPGLYDTVQLFFGNGADPVHERQLEGPIPDADFWLEVPPAKLEEGVHALFYRVLPWNGSPPRESLSVIVTIDKTPPILATDSQLIFPLEVRPPNKLTARYLELNNDEVKADLPSYTSPRPGDRITWYWGTSPGTQDQGGVIELDDRNYSDPVVITISADLIQDRGDGWRYASYEVQDRAGNKSQRSDSVELDVAATPIPRVLPPSKVKEASGGVANGVLIPGNAVNGVTVTIPPEAVIHTGENVFVQWGAPGTVGEYRTNTPETTGSRDYKIPNTKIAQHMGKTLPVTYEVFEPGVDGPHISQLYSLRMEDLTGLPTVQCDKVAGGKLSLASVTTGFASFTLEKWTLMGTDQFLTVTVEGVDASSQRLVIPVLTESPVPPVAQVIPAGQISKTDLQRFKLNFGFEVRVKVSFDNKQSWKSFPMLTPTLIA